LYGAINDIPSSGYKSVEVEPIAVVLDVSGKVYFARIIGSPNDGPLKLCSVYLREDGGGAVCIADFSSKEEALEYARAVGTARNLPVKGSMFDLRIREVPGRGYIADPREGRPYTLDPAKAALYHESMATEYLFTGAAGEHGRWLDWFDATTYADDRDAAKAALLDRVLAAVREAMGVSAPALGSEDEQLLRGRLRNAVEDTRSDRLVIFDAPLRDFVREQLAGAGFEVEGYESDEDLCDMLVDLEGEVLFVDLVDLTFDAELEQKLVMAFASDAAAAAIHSAIARKPRLHESGMVAVIHSRIEGHGLVSPFAELFAEDLVAGDRPTA
jgi:hypothetical protein